MTTKKELTSEQEHIWQKLQTKNFSLFNDLDDYELIMNGVTCDSYPLYFNEDDYRFFDYHCDIIDKHFPLGDWSWDLALPYWSEEMIKDAIDAYYIYLEGTVVQQGICDPSEIERIFEAEVQSLKEEGADSEDIFDMACDGLCLFSSNKRIQRLYKECAEKDCEES